MSATDDRGEGTRTLAFNLSARSLHDLGFCDRLAERCAAARVDPARFRRAP